MITGAQSLIPPMITKTFWLLMIVAFIASAITFPVVVAHRVKTTSQQLATQSRRNEHDVPIADFNAPQEVDQRKRFERLLKNQRHNLRDKNLSQENRAKFILREGDLPRSGPPPQSGSPSGQNARSSHQYSPPVIGGAVTDETPAEAALPTYNSDAVVIGNITSAAAYLSEDKTNVYSEFALQVSQVLKSPLSGLDPEVPLLVLRPGGGVRFPSGNVKYVLVSGRGFPHVNKRYLLFLKYDNLSQSFYIVTGYELSDGKVVPLDSVPPGGSKAHPFASYESYTGVNESKFLADVWDAITHPVRPPQTGFPVTQATPQ